MSDRKLARYQAALMSLLARTDIDDAERMRRLSTEPAFLPFREHVRAFDRDFVCMGAGIMARWGRRSGGRRGEERGEGEND